MDGNQNGDKGPHVKKWLNRHGKSLTVAVAGVVLAMFVVKDVLREEMKDLADGIQSAAIVYTSRDENRLILDRLNEMEIRETSGEAAKSSGAMFAALMQEYDDDKTRNTWMRNNGRRLMAILHKPSSALQGSFQSIVSKLGETDIVDRCREGEGHGIRGPN